MFTTNSQHSPILFQIHSPFQSNNYWKIITHSNADNQLLSSCPTQHLISQELFRAKFNYRIKFNNQVSPFPTRHSITGELPCGWNTTSEYIMLRTASSEKSRVLIPGRLLCRAKFVLSRSHRNSVARESEGRNFAENPAPLSARLYLARIIAGLGIGTRHEMARLKI